MRLFYTHRFLRDYTKAPIQVQETIDKHLTYLTEDLLHPSLHAKKYDEGRDIWQARVNKNWRFYFRIEGNTYFLLGVTRHPK